MLFWYEFICPDVGGVDSAYAKNILINNGGVGRAVYNIDASLIDSRGEGVEGHIIYSGINKYGILVLYAAGE